MPYFVFAIHNDQTNNRCYHADPIMDHAVAERLYLDMRRGRVQGDNYVVEMIRADSFEEADALADAKRPYPQRS